MHTIIGLNIASN